MDDLLEQGLAKKNDQLHTLIKNLITELDHVVIRNENGFTITHRIESSKPLFTKLISLINEFEPSPKLLDIGLDFYIKSLSNMYLKLYENASAPLSNTEAANDDEDDNDDEENDDDDEENDDDDEGITDSEDDSDLGSDADTHDEAPDLEHDAKPIGYQDTVGKFVDKLKSARIKSSQVPTTVPDTPRESAILLSLATNIATVVYNFAKIRGFKFISNYFSSDVYLIPKLISMIQSTPQLPDVQIFFNLIWLSNLALVPFPLRNVNQALPEDLFQIGLQHLTSNSNASKTQLVSLILLSRLLTREDMIKEGKISQYFNEYVYKQWHPESKTLEGQQQAIDQNVKLGHMMTINKILKKISNDTVNQYTDFIYHQLIEVDLLQLRMQIEENLRFGKLSNLNILYIIKILSKLSKFYLQAKNYAAVSKIINNLLNDIMNPMVDRFDTSLRYCLAKNLSYLVSNLSAQAVNYQEQLVLYMIAQLNIPNLEIDYLPFDPQSNGTTTLTKKQNVFKTNLIINSNELSITKYHTILLFLAYISLNKSLPKHLIPTVFSIVHQTIFVSQRRATASLGNQIRDSSCFIVWSLCRHITKNELKQLALDQNFMVQNIVFDLIKVIIFDDDLIIRRCGIAVMQEFVGRFGVECFGDSIIKEDNEALGQFIIKFIEYFNNMSIGSLNLSYLIIGKLIKIGFPQKIFVPLILENIINDDNSFAVKKLNSNHLINILQLKQGDIDREINFQIDDRGDPDTIPIIKILDTLINEVDNNNNSGELNTGALYSVSELLNLIDINIIIESYPQLIAMLDNFKFDFHHDSLEKGESYLKWINSCLGNSKFYSVLIRSDKLWPNLFSISRLKYDQGLVLEFKIFFELLKQNQIRISFENFNKLIYYIKNNNLLIAKSLIYYKFTDDNFLEIMKLIENTNIDCDTRSLILKGLSDNLYVYDLSEPFLLRVVNMLDDYTVTNQGDVGSKIRMATLNLIQNNLRNFLETKTINELENKLIRLSGELMDKIKYESFKLLLKINSINDPQIYHVLEEGDNATFSSSENEDPDHKNEKLSVRLDDAQFYKVLLEYYQRQILQKILLEDKYLDHYKNLSVNFWKGIVFSMGSFTGTNSVINESFVQVLKLVERLTESEKLYMFNELLKLLRIPPETKLSELNSRQLKVYMMSLNLLVRLFESSVNFPVAFNYNTLFVRCYNLQINTSNVTRIGLVLKNFQHISTNDKVEKALQQKCRSKIILIACSCPLSKVRSMASEVLFEIINELNSRDVQTIKMLDSVDWEKSPKDLKQYVVKLEKAFTNI